jgi:ActR/RegA family two-component response regulator
MNTAGSTHAETPSTTPRILIVDDEESILFAMGDYFTVRGYTVDCARDRDEALALLAARAYGVVIVDLRLSMTRDDEGLDVIGHVHDHHPPTRTILLTAYWSPAIELEARRRGLDEVLLKPQPLGEIARVVERLLARGP